MNLLNCSIQKIFEESEIANLKAAIQQDSVIISSIIKILEDRKGNCRASPEMLKHAAYPFERAAKDGAQLELDFLLNLLTDYKDKE